MGSPSKVYPIKIQFLPGSLSGENFQLACASVNGSQAALFAPSTTNLNVEHTCFDCKFLLRAFMIIDRCFHLYETSTGPCSSVCNLLMKAPDTALGIPPGLLA